MIMSLLSLHSILLYPHAIGRKVACDFPCFVLAKKISCIILFRGWNESTVPVPSSAPACSFSPDNTRLVLFKWLTVTIQNYQLSNAEICRPWFVLNGFQIPWDRHAYRQERCVRIWNCADGDPHRTTSHVHCSQGKIGTWLKFTYCIEVMTTLGNALISLMFWGLHKLLGPEDITWMLVAFTAVNAITNLMLHA